jgi:protein-disulfide isomerase
MKDKVMPILVGALVLFAFISGSLWTKVKTLEKRGKVEEAEEMGEGAEVQQQEPEAPTVLGAEDQAEIIKNAAAVKGAEDVKVTIVEFSEYQCPFCKRYVDQTYSQILSEYGDKIRYIFRDYPLPFHPNAQKTSEAARCAGDQGKYWEYHDKLFEEQEEWTEGTEVIELLEGYAQELGLNKSKFSSCLTNGEKEKAVKDDLALGQKVGVSGTPSFFINGTMLVGAQPFEAFQALIDEELNK